VTVATTYAIRDECSPKFGRQRLTLWSGSYCSDYEGEAIELPRHNGYMVNVGGDLYRVHCPSPRTEENYETVDNVINETIAAATCCL
jgi:hypothetical protein